MLKVPLLNSGQSTNHNRSIVCACVTQLFYVLDCTCCELNINQFYLLKTRRSSSAWLFLFFFVSFSWPYFWKMWTGWVIVKFGECLGYKWLACGYSYWKLRVLHPCLLPWAEQKLLKIPRQRFSGYLSNLGIVSVCLVKFCWNMKISKFRNNFFWTQACFVKVLAVLASSVDVWVINSCTVALFFFCQHDCLGL